MGEPNQDVPVHWICLASTGFCTVLAKAGEGADRVAKIVATIREATSRKRRIGEVRICMVFDGGKVRLGVSCNITSLLVGKIE